MTTEKRPNKFQVFWRKNIKPWFVADEEENALWMKDIDLPVTRGRRKTDKPALFAWLVAMATFAALLIAVTVAASLGRDTDAVDAWGNVCGRADNRKVVDVPSTGIDMSRHPLLLHVYDFLLMSDASTTPVCVRSCPHPGFSCARFMSAATPYSRHVADRVCAVAGEVMTSDRMTFVTRGRHCLPHTLTTNRSGDDVTRPPPDVMLRSRFAGFLDDARTSSGALTWSAAIASVVALGCFLLAFNFRPASAARRTPLAFRAVALVAVTSTWIVYLVAVRGHDVVKSTTTAGGNLTVVSGMSARSHDGFASVFLVAAIVATSLLALAEALGWTRTREGAATAAVLYGEAQAALRWCAWCYLLPLLSALALLACAAVLAHALAEVTSLRRYEVAFDPRTNLTRLLPRARIPAPYPHLVAALAAWWCLHAVTAAQSFAVATATCTWYFTVGKRRRVPGGVLRVASARLMSFHFGSVVVASFFAALTITVAKVISVAKISKAIERRCEKLKAETSGGSYDGGDDVTVTRRTSDVEGVTCFIGERFPHECLARDTEMCARKCRRHDYDAGKRDAFRSVDERDSSSVPVASQGWMPRGNRVDTLNFSYEDGDEAKTQVSNIKSRSSGSKKGNSSSSSSDWKLRFYRSVHTLLYPFRYVEENYLLYNEGLPMVALLSAHYIQGGRLIKLLLQDHPQRHQVGEMCEVSGYFLLLTKLSLLAITLLLTFVSLPRNEDLFFHQYQIVFALVIAGCMAHVTLSLISAAINSLFACYLFDHQLNDGSSQKPFYGSPRFYSALYAIQNRTSASRYDSYHHDVYDLNRDNGDDVTTTFDVDAITDNNEDGTFWPTDGSYRGDGEDLPQHRIRSSDDDDRSSKKETVHDSSNENSASKEKCISIVKGTSSNSTNKEKEKAQPEKDSCSESDIADEPELVPSVVRIISDAARCMPGSSPSDPAKRSARIGDKLSVSRCIVKAKSENDGAGCKPVSKSLFDFIKNKIFKSKSSIREREKCSVEKASVSSPVTDDVCITVEKPVCSDESISKKASKTQKTVSSECEQLQEIKSISIAGASTSQCEIDLDDSLKQQVQNTNESMSRLLEKIAGIIAKSGAATSLESGVRRDIETTSKTEAKSSNTEAPVQKDERSIGNLKTVWKKSSEIRNSAPSKQGLNSKKTPSPGASKTRAESETDELPMANVKHRDQGIGRMLEKVAGIMKRGVMKSSNVGAAPVQAKVSNLVEPEKDQTMCEKDERGSTRHSPSSGHNSVSPDKDEGPRTSQNLMADSDDAYLKHKVKDMNQEMGQLVQKIIGIMAENGARPSANDIKSKAVATDDGSRTSSSCRSSSDSSDEEFFPSSDRTSASPDQHVISRHHHLRRSPSDDVTSPRNGLPPPGTKQVDRERDRLRVLFCDEANATMKPNRNATRVGDDAGRAAKSKTRNTEEINVLYRSKQFEKARSEPAHRQSDEAASRSDEFYRGDGSSDGAQELAETIERVMSRLRRSTTLSSASLSSDTVSDDWRSLIRTKKKQHQRR